MAREETKMSKIVNEEVLFGAKRASSQTKNLDSVWFVKGGVLTKDSFLCPLFLDLR